LLDGLGGHSNMASHLPHRIECASLLHRARNSPRAKSSSGEIQQAGSQRDEGGEEAKEIQISLPGTNVSRGRHISGQPTHFREVRPASGRERIPLKFT